MKYEEQRDYDAASGADEEAREQHAGGVTVADRIGKYLSVRKHPADPVRRTWRWTVLTNHGGCLGVVQWFPRWRQYCFDPSEGTTFNDGCLRDLVVFLERVNREHREARATMPRTAP